MSLSKHWFKIELSQALTRSCAAESVLLVVLVMPARYRQL